MLLQGWPGHSCAESSAIREDSFARCVRGVQPQEVLCRFIRLLLLRNTDTFAEKALRSGKAGCGKVSVPPAANPVCSPTRYGIMTGRQLLTPLDAACRNEGY